MSRPSQRCTAAGIVTGAALAACALMPAPAGAQAPNGSLADAVAGGRPSLALRYRLESVDDDAFAKDGFASTLRAALGYSTARWHGLAATVRVQSVLDLGARDRHNDKGTGSAWNGIGDRPVIADPSETDFNEAYLDWQVGAKSAIRAGRQEILLDNVRFVGNVGWRQFHQSFDAVRLDTDAIPGTHLTYAYVYNQNRIFTDTKKMSSHLLNLGWKVGSGGHLSTYGYLIDYDRKQDSGLSTATLGARWNGAAPLGGGWKGLYDLEVAHQSDSGDNQGSIDAGYYRATFGASAGVWTVKAGYELLEGSPGHGAFTTPFATLHAWNGWADKFLGTPANGLRDLNLAVSAKSGAWNVTAVSHDFAADSGGADYGSEIDVIALWKLAWKQTFAVKAALYDAEAFSTDVTKLWAFTTWKF